MKQITKHEGLADEAPTPDEWQLSREWWNALRPDQRASIVQKHNATPFARGFGYVIRTGRESFLPAFVRETWKGRGCPVPGKLAKRTAA